MARDRQEDDTQEMAEELGKRMKLEKDELALFVHRVMTRCGYRAEPQYVKNDKDDKRKDDDGGYGFM